MTYLYGDATPFPLEENFIETMCAAIDTCVALYQIDMELADKRRDANDIAAECDSEINRLAALSRAVEAALAPILPKSEGTYAAQSAAQSISAHASEVVKQMRMSVLRKRDDALHSPTQLNLGPRMLHALTPFVLRHHLPKTDWYMRWRGARQSGEASLMFTSESACGLELGFRADIPAESRWLAPVRVEELVPSLRLELLHEGGWLKRKPHGSKKAIHRFYITQVETSAEQVWLELRQHPIKPSLGYEIVLQNEANPLIYPINAKDERSDALTVVDEEAQVLFQLWSAIESEIVELMSKRREVISARLRNTDIANLEEPAELAEAMLMSMAPLIREIRVRSRVPGEYVLKRELGDGRREEVFVPRKEVEGKFAGLPEEYQSCFHAVGLGTEATSDFLRLEFPLHATTDADETTPRQPLAELLRPRHAGPPATESDASAA